MLALKILFCVFSVIYILTLIVHKKFVSKMKDNVKISNYVAFIAFSLMMYIVLGLILSVFLKGILAKVVVLMFALSPIFIGRIATYEKEKLFTAFQLVLMFVSTIFVLSI